MTLDTFEPDLMKLLYPGTLKPYFVYKWERSGQASVIRHYPPALKANTPGLSGPPTAIGFRGLMVNNYDQPMSEQGYVKLAWVGLDIDAEDNANVVSQLKLGRLGDYVHSLLCNRPAVVRYSKSGLGCHVLVPLAELALMPYDRAKAVAKRISKKYEDELSDEGIVTCVTGLPNMWLYTQGGQQKTLGLCNDLYKVSEQELDFATPQPGTTEGHALDDGPAHFSGMAARVIAQLINDGVVSPNMPGKTQINIGRVKRSLIKIGIEFDTRSKCRVEHESEPNGYVELLNDGTVRLFSNADNNSFIMTLVSS